MDLIEWSLVIMQQITHLMDLVARMVVLSTYHGALVFLDLELLLSIFMNFISGVNGIIRYLNFPPKFGIQTNEFII